MSLLANIEHLAIAPGIEAVVVDTESRDSRGAGSWHPVLEGALDLFTRTEEKSIRLVVGKHTIVVQKEGEETVAVVLPTGHAIAKSLRRMIRRMARKDRGPLPKSKQDQLAQQGTVQAPVTPPAATPSSAAPSLVVDEDKGLSAAAPAPTVPAPAESSISGF